MTLGPLMIDVQGTTLTEEDRDLLQHPLVGAVILLRATSRASNNWNGSSPISARRVRRRCS